MKKLEQVVQYFERTPLTFRTWCVSFFAVVAIRLLVENLLTSVKSKELTVFIGASLQTLLFFAMSYLLAVIYLKLVLKESFSKLAAIVLWGQWVIIFPPIIDKLVFGDRAHYSFYIFDSFSQVIHRFFTFFGDNLDFGITIGTRVEVFLVVILLGVYAWVKSKKVLKAILVAMGLYIILFALGVFPSLVTFVLKGFSLGLGTISGVTVAQMFLSPLRFFDYEIQDLYGPLNFRLNLIYNLLLFGLVIILQWLISKERLYALWRNIRFPQTVFNSGLLLAGIGMGMFYFRDGFYLDAFVVLVVLNLLLAVFSAWYFSVFVNDISDQSIDEMTNSDRPLVKQLFSQSQYIDHSLVFLFFSLSSSLIIGVKFLLIILCYHVLTFVYSAYPFRLKRFLGVASLLSAFASLLFFAMGYILVSEGQSLANMPWRVAALLFVGYALAIPLKDIKDIEGDRKDGVFTLPVLVGEQHARLILATVILICYFASISVFNERTLFLPALLCGSASFWIITNKKITPRNVNWQVLLVAAIYVMLLAVIVMIKM